MQKLKTLDSKEKQFGPQKKLLLFLAAEKISGPILMLQISCHGLKSVVPNVYPNFEPWA